MNPSPDDPATRPADWEAFYRDYRKPGYVAGFEITTKLGGGMFGLVFRARRMSIGKDYAIKFLQVDDAQVRTAVLSELEQVKYFAQIDHPNLVSIEDRGEVDGIPFLVMAFAGTETLRDKMPSGRVPTAEEKDELLRFFLQACRGLAALHERSLVHFDIKPANVFLKGSVARLGDYGLSKLVTHSRGSLSMGRGTPYYMAPEMLQRRGDARSDIYSLGVLLYELLCGKVPFTGDSEWAVLKQHETAQPELPAHLTSRERTVLLRCMHKDPAARFQSVHDLIGAFGAPSSVGAAAWSDVRSRSQSSAAPSKVVPPPLPGAAGAAASGPPNAEEDPVAGLGRASREAMRHASTLAQKAAKEAGKFAQKAAANAQRVVRDAVERSRSSGMRRYFAMKLLNKRRRNRQDRDQVMGIASAIAEGPERRRRHRWLLLPAATGLGLLFLAAMFTMGSPIGPTTTYTTWSDGQRVESASAGSVSMKPAGDRTATFLQFTIPRGYKGQVATSEPAWVESAQHDVERARAELDEQIRRLRSIAPLDEAARLAIDELPVFTVRATKRELAGVERRVGEIAAAATLEPEAVERLLADAPMSLVVTAQSLARIAWRTPGDFERAMRLQQMLEQTTHCKDLPVYGDDSMPLPELAARNRHLGELWLWFVNEFAHTPRAWQAYRQLLDR